MDALGKATEAIPPMKVASGPKNPWSDDELLQGLLAERKALLLTDRQAYRRKQRQIRARAAQLRNEHYQREATLLNAAKEAREIESAYVRAKNQVSILRKKPPGRKCPNLGAHFQNHFNSDHSTP